MSWFWMNQALVGLASPASRERFQADPDAYLSGFDLSGAERDAIKRKDVLALWDLGVQPYLLRQFQRRTGIADADFVAALQGRSYDERA